MRREGIGRGLNLNAPVDGVRPDPTYSNIIEAVSDASARQHTIGLNYQIGALPPPVLPANAPRIDWKRAFLFGQYTYGVWRSNFEGQFSPPPTGTLATEWGPNSNDASHRLNFTLVSQTLKNLQAQVGLNMASALPYTIRTGSDDNQGIDPLWMLNHFHFLDSGREGRRPLTFSRYAGPGSHRYPVGFSGDTVISWASLEFQPEFTATASNIGYGWWSHDVGGHLFGVRDDELATRWVQLGLFSPILRLHSSSNPFLVKEPWMYPAESRDGDDRRAAVPPPARALPAHDEPPRRRRGTAAGAADVPPRARSDPRAYEVPNQFGFGSELLVAPITTPRDAVTLRGAVRAWLPPGVWIDVFTGTVYDGDREIELHRDGGTIPALAARRRHPAARRPRTSSTRPATPSGSSCSSRRAPTARSR